MAAEIKKLAEELEAAGYKQAGQVLNGVKEGLRRAHLVPEKLPEKTIFTSPTTAKPQESDDHPWKSRSEIFYPDDSPKQNPNDTK